MTSRSLWCWPLVGLIVLFAAAAIGPEISPYRAEVAGDRRLEGPSWAHWCGTDLHGRDVLTRCLHGARISLAVGCVGAAVSLIIGTTVGVACGYFGGWIDTLFMRVVDLLYAMPRIIWVILLIAAFDAHVKKMIAGWLSDDWVSHSRLLLLFVALGMVEWLTLSRIVRAQVSSLRERQFILAAKALGQRPEVIMFRHLLPHVYGLVLVYLTLTVPVVILEESFLSFLGLGVEAPFASWGTLLSDGAQYINPLAVPWWLIITPAVLMAFTLLCLNQLGDGLRDLLDPKLRNT